MTQGFPVDGVTHEVGNPFMVIATRNPTEQAGTSRLPEAQLDRFVMTTSIGCPDHASSVQIRQISATRGRSGELTPRLCPQVLNDLTRLAPEVLHELSGGPVRDALESATRALLERRR